MPFLVLVCGSRDWTDRAAIERDLVELQKRHGGEFEVVSGGARGADRIAAEICRARGIVCHEELADWVGQGRRAGPLRNRRMAALGPLLGLAYKDGLDSDLARGGTEDMLRVLLAGGIEAWNIHHDGGRAVYRRVERKSA